MPVLRVCGWRWREFSGAAISIHLFCFLPKRDGQASIGDYLLMRMELGPMTGETANWF
jgi:hypothetical protein